jgi:hypothetical protein
MGAPVMWVLFPHSLGAEVLASLTLGAVWWVRRGSAPPRRADDTDEDEAR